MTAPQASQGQQCGDVETRAAGRRHMTRVSLDGRVSETTNVRFMVVRPQERWPAGRPLWSSASGRFGSGPADGHQPSNDSNGADSGRSANNASSEKIGLELTPP